MWPSSSSSSSAGTKSGGGGTNASDAITQARLTAQDGSNATGLATFGRVKNVPVLQVQLFNLKPSPAGSGYAFWLYRSKRVALPVGIGRVGPSGKFTSQIPIPTAFLQLLARGTFDQVDVSLTSRSQFTAQINAARKTRTAPKYVGTSVLRGPITGPGFSAKASNG